jgi:hypothetical protein
MEIAMKNILKASSLLCLFATGIAYADCRSDCTETYKKDAAYCKTIGDPNAQGNCIARANETYESCRAGCK